MKKDYLKQIMGDGNYEITSEGVVIPKKQKAIEKLEPEFIPCDNLFGLNDKGQFNELAAVMKDRGVIRINMCYPLDTKDEALYAKTILMAQRFKEVGFLVSVCNIDSIEKVKRVMALKPSYLNKVSKVFEVEKYCFENDIPFMPGVKNSWELLVRVAYGYRIVKAYPYIENNLHRMAENCKNNNILIDAAGGLRPVELNEAGEPVKMNETFKACTELDSVIIVSSTQAAKAFLNKPEDEKALDKLDKYLSLIN